MFRYFVSSLTFIRQRGSDTAGDGLNSTKYVVLDIRKRRLHTEIDISMPGPVNVEELGEPLKSMKKDIRAKKRTTLR